MKAIWVAVPVALALGGGLPVRGTGEAFMSEDAINAKDEATCRTLGATPGTPTFIDCRLRLRSDRSNQDTARRFSP